ncbi:MAG: sigma-54-dependent Fis family transcriptional regulator [Deltaproteobacteria bacterium]|nr:sigma-54-dependent Fis family transcriptional regulator [Deltaproteobacteria bacterium]
MMKLKILIVDDDRKLLSVLKTIFVEENDEVTVSNDGLKAIKICRNEKFDLVITDLMMPGANGLEVLKETRKNDPDILVILITGFASLETAVKAIREGAYDYITKPFKLDELKIIVNNAREKIRLTRENRKLFHELQGTYKELHTMKKIIGINKEHGPAGERSGPEPEVSNKPPFIAGSMLPFYYTEKMSDINLSVLSELERISVLREKGFLSEEEFGLCKSKLFRDIKH